MPSGAEFAEVRAAVEEGYQHLDYAQRVALANEYYAFLSRMAAAISSQPSPATSSRPAW